MDASLSRLGERVGVRGSTAGAQTMRTKRGERRRPGSPGRARALRRQSTDAEKRLWLVLRGRQLGGRLAGLVAALLLATNYVHIIINSHVAWSNSLTPFFTTLAMLFAAQAFGDRSGAEKAEDTMAPPRWMVATALATGLALQTHPTALVVALAIAVLGLRSAAGRRSLRTVYPYLCGGLVLLLEGAGAVVLVEIRPVVVMVIHPQIEVTISVEVTPGGVAKWRAASRQAGRRSNIGKDRETTLWFCEALAETGILSSNRACCREK